MFCHINGGYFLFCLGEKRVIEFVLLAAPSIVMTILMRFSSLVDVVIYSSAWCECGGLCWQPPQYRDWYTPQGGEGGLASGGDCLRISDALTVTPTGPQQLGGVGVASSFVHFLHMNWSPLLMSSPP